jgi:hypothetical protein
MPKHSASVNATEPLRFSRSDIRVRRDGLTPEALGLPLISRAVWYAAFSRKQAMKPSFRRSSIKIAGKQLNGCAGFLLVTSTDRSVSSLLGAGSVYQRALLRATDLRVAHHTMSYALEEDPWRQEIDSAMPSERPIQFMVRIGQSKAFGPPDYPTLHGDTAREWDALVARAVWVFALPPGVSAGDGRAPPGNAEAVKTLNPSQGDHDGEGVPFD